MRKPQSHGWELSPTDQQAVLEISSQLPERIYDAHAHFYRTADFAEVPPFMARGPSVAGLAEWRTYLGAHVGANRPQGALVLPFPTAAGDPAVLNRFVLDQTRDAGDAARAALLLSPGMEPSDLGSTLDDPQVGGFKVYHVYARRQPTFDATISEFVPEWAWRYAHERGWFVMLHLVRDGALADPENQREIRRRCEAYPNLKLILAHAARGFHAPNTARGIGSLAGLDNVWFDSSAICEAEPLISILHAFGPRKLLYGSDFPISHQRGRSITLGSGFAWITTDQSRLGAQAASGQPVPVGVESIRALLRATEVLGLDEDDRQDIFADNARRLLGITQPDPRLLQDQYARAQRIIPGGVQLLSKRPERFAPEKWPAYFREARGCEIWDDSGRHFYDLSLHGIGASILGYRDPDVTRAVIRRVNLGSYCTLNSFDEVRLAELLCELHPWAQEVRFARSGGEIMTVAVRIARATTGRSQVAICGYHGWHDWYLAANLGESDALSGHLLPGLNPTGVPPELRGSAHTFSYNDRDALARIIANNGARLAAVVMEPCRRHPPEPGFLEFVRDAAHEAGALLIFDEVSIGWRLARGGAHLRFGITPDLAVFGKSLGAGHPVAAVIGSRGAMEGAHRSFISSTYWTEGVGFAAGLAAVTKMVSLDLPSHCRHIGEAVLQVWRDAGERHGVPLKFTGGFPALADFEFDHPQALELRTCYTQLMLERGFLATPSLYVSWAHTEEVVARYAIAVAAVMATLGKAVQDDTITQTLTGPAAETGFARLL